MTPEAAQSLSDGPDSPESEGSDDQSQFEVHEGGMNQEPVSNQAPDWQENARTFNSPVFPTSVREEDYYPKTPSKPDTLDIQELVRQGLERSGVRLDPRTTEQVVTSVTSQVQLAMPNH